MLDPTVGILIDLGGAALLASAAAHKIRRLADFGEAFTAYRVLPVGWSRRAAVLVPCTELAIAAALIAAPTRRAGALAAAALLAAYAAAIALNLRRGRRELDCGCAGPGHRRPIGAWMVWRNLALAAALAGTSQPWSGRALGPVDALTLAAGLAAAALLYAATERLLGEIAPKGSAMRASS